MSEKTLKVIISGGGTGGHIYPAIAIANTIKEKHPNAEILFVGAEGRMEMEKVPKAGYKIIGLPVTGLQRSLSPRNLSFPIRLAQSLFRAKKIIKDFRPDIVVGVGGYASGPVLRMAAWADVPILIQEQNSFAGLANRWLSKFAGRICVAYEGMEKVFPADKLVLTGNPVRKDIVSLEGKREEALKHFGLSADKPVLLVLGGSLGARTINESIGNGLQELVDNGIQLLWQTGKGYYEDVRKQVDALGSPLVKASDFIYEMDLAYAVADVVVSRAGALSVSELCLAGKPSILVPSPNVTDDHQTKNAMALVEKDAAWLVKDVEAGMHLIKEVLRLVQDTQSRTDLGKNIKALAKPLAAEQIADEALALAGQHT